MRTKSRWNQNARPRSIAQMANALAAVIWKSASQNLLNLENENFEVRTQQQRLDVLEELVSFLIHVTDRWIYERASTEQRASFISSLANDVARLLSDSRDDAQGEGAHRALFLNKLNNRSSEYAEYSFDKNEGASFRLRSALGLNVAASMGERDNKWIPDYIIGREAPEAELALYRSLKGLVRFDDSEETPSSN